MEGRDYGDNDILKATVQEKSEDGKTVRFKTVLPGTEKEVTSEWMNPDDIKSAVIMTWCESIRSQIDAYAREQEALRKRGDINTDIDEEDYKKETVEEVTDPIDYAKHQRDLYHDRVDILEQRINDAKAERTKVREHFE